MLKIKLECPLFNIYLCEQLKWSYLVQIYFSEAFESIPEDL